MDQPRRNEGIIVTGGTVTADQIAVGHKARAVKKSIGAVGDRGRDEVAQALEELVRVLQAHAAQLDDAEELLDASRTVADELAKEKPNKRTVGAVLASIGEAAGNLVSVVSAVDRLAAVAATVF
jgi:uncharacterized protein YqeY